MKITLAKPAWKSWLIICGAIYFCCLFEMLIGNEKDGEPFSLAQFIFVPIIAVPFTIIVTWALLSLLNGAARWMKSRSEVFKSIMMFLFVLLHVLIAFPSARQVVVNRPTVGGWLFAASLFIPAGFFLYLMCLPERVDRVSSHLKTEELSQS